MPAWLLLCLAVRADTAFLLDNGLRVAVVEDHRAPRVVVALAVAAGAADAEQPGATHLLEHTLFEGSRAVPGQGFDLALAEVGGDSNAWTHHDVTVFSQVLPPGALERALFLEADRLGWPSLDPAAVAVQREVVWAEGAPERDAAHGADAAALAALLYPGHPYGRTLTGLREGGPPADADALRDLWVWAFAPERCAVVVAGAVDPAAAEALVRATLGAIPARVGGARPAALAPALEGERRRVLRADVGDRTLILAWRGVARGEPDEPALALLAWLLAGRGDAGLQRALVDRGRARRVEAWSDAWRLGGGFVVAVGAWRGQLGPLRRAVDREIARLASEGPTEAEIERARGAWRGTYLRAADSAERAAPLLAECLLTTGGTGCLDAELARIAAVTPEDVRRAAAGLRDAPGRVLLSVVAPGDRPLRGSTLAVDP